MLYLTITHNIRCVHWWNWGDIMQLENNGVKEIAKGFGLPVIGDGSHIWFFRTQSGIFYYDFYINHYIALGWDLIPAPLVSNDKRSYDDKKEDVSELYPEEKRPGLILGQMETFYNKMQAGDLVVIPAMGGKRIAVGVLGNIASEIVHQYPDDEYERCEYNHKRSVKWLKQIDLWTDVYLLRVLRAQQTISDITEYAEMIYRNLHPCYVSENALHLTLVKKAESDYRAKDNIDLQTSILAIHSLVSEYYGVLDQSGSIVVKTAVGSPGFLEIILPYVPTSVITAICTIRAIIGKTTSNDGKTNTGIMAILTKGNELLNDHSARKKAEAEIQQIEANTEKIKAETAYTEALTRKVNAEAESIEISNMYALTATSGIAEKSKVIRTAAIQSGISIDNPLEEVS